MLVEKSNLLQRVRVVMIALVAVIGFGTMAMKPDVRAAHTYGVAETSGGLNWRIVADVTGQTSNDYDCSDPESNSLCTIYTDATLTPGQTIPITSGQAGQPGKFSQ